ncbi:MAG: calcium/sodium antiporter [Acidobacteriota bacterium]
MDLLILIAGLTVLLVGGEVLVRGASSLARILGMPPLIIGMTVLAFGTSAPELAVNVGAAWKGQTAITFGNVVGSNIANIGLIIGLTVMIKAMEVHRSIITREIPVMLVATAGTILLGSDWLLKRTPDAIDRMDGVLLLGGFAAFLVMTARSALRIRQEDLFLRQAQQEQEKQRPVHWSLALLLLVLGLAGVIQGGDWTVDGATRIAESLGMSQVVIGLSIVSVGTSLPELTTSLLAARRGHADMAIGTVVGSNVFNLLLILGVSSTIHTVAIPDQGWVDFLVLAAFSAVLLPFAISQRKLARIEGLLLFLCYVAYIFLRIAI